MVKKKLFTSANYTAGQLNAIVKLLKKQAGGEDGPERFLRGEFTISDCSRSWREQDGVIYFSVYSEGITKKEWIANFKLRGYRVRGNATDAIFSTSFISTNRVSYEIAILKGELFNDNNRNIENIFDEAKKRNLINPNIEIACLIRNKFSNEDIMSMGLNSIITICDPIDGSIDNSLFFITFYNTDSDQGLLAYPMHFGSALPRKLGFVFVASEMNIAN